MSTAEQQNGNELEDLLREASELYRSDPQLALERLDFLEANYDLSLQPDNHCSALMLRSFLMRLLRPDQSREDYLLQALEIAERYNLRHRRGRVLGALGELAMFFGKYELAQTRTLLALDIALELDDPKTIGHAAGTLCQISFMINDFQAAIRYGHQALESYKRTNHTVGHAAALGSIGRVYAQMDEFDTAIEYDKRALKLTKSVNDKKSSFEHCMNLAGSYIDKKQFQQAVDYLEQAEQFARKGRPNFVRGVHAFLAFAHANLANLRRARKYLQQAGRPSQDDITVLEFDTYYALVFYRAATLKLLQEPQEARDVLQELLSLQSINMPRDQVEDVHTLMASILHELGRDSEARYYQEVSERMQQERRDLKVVREVYAITSRREALAREQTGGSTLHKQPADNKAVLNKLQETLSSHVRSSEVLTAIKNDITNNLPELGGGAARIATSTLNKINNGLEALQHSPLPDGYLEQHYQQLIQELRVQAPLLTPAELRICVLLHLKFRSKDIARMLACSNDTVSTHRKHIRKKLNLPKGENLTSFLVAL